MVNRLSNSNKNEFRFSIMVLHKYSKSLEKTDNLSLGRLIVWVSLTEKL
jgi:hypothetical protein